MLYFNKINMSIWRYQCKFTCPFTHCVISFELRLKRVKYHHIFLRIFHTPHFIEPLHPYPKPYFIRLRSIGAWSAGSMEWVVCFGHLFRLFAVIHMSLVSHSLKHVWLQSLICQQGIEPYLNFKLINCFIN